MVELHGAPPLSAKANVTAAGIDITLVSSAASLLEGDRLDIDVHVSGASRLTVTSAAAQLAFPCPEGGHTEFVVRAHVADRAALVWRPEPLVVAAGGRHRTFAEVHLEPDAAVLWVDEAVLGRSGEPPEACELMSSLRIDRAGLPVWRDALHTARAGARGPGVLGEHRYLATIVDVGVGALTDSATELLSFPLAVVGRWHRSAAPTTVGRDRLLASLDSALRSAAGE